MAEGQDGAAQLLAGTKHGVDHDHTSAQVLSGRHVMNSDDGLGPREGGGTRFPDRLRAVVRLNACHRAERHKVYGGVVTIDQD
jgi:hypothetical protein